jgi:hypothetical protein
MGISAFISPARRSPRFPGVCHIAAFVKPRSGTILASGGVMYSGTNVTLSVYILFGGVSIAAQPAAAQKIDLSEGLTAGKLRILNREATKHPERNGIHLPAKDGGGVIWIEGSDFKTGAIEVDVRGRDEFQRSFVGLAFHGRDDKTYEAVYLRPFNFRAEDPMRKQHAVQYMSLPDYDWQRLRKEFPEEFENPVDASIVPTDWVRLRIVVEGQKIQVYVGATTTPALEVRKLGQLEGGMVGLWATGDSEFANLVISPMK